MRVDVAGRVERAVPGPAVTISEWMLSSLATARRVAQMRAELAYDEWRSSPGGQGAAAYRDAQDRADAMQDEFARLTQILSTR